MIWGSPIACVFSCRICDGSLYCRMDDEILTVNNVSLGNVTHLQAVQALKDAGQHVTLV